MTHLSHSITLKLPHSWHKALKKELELSYVKELLNFLNKEYQSNTNIYPSKDNIFKALELTSFEKTSVVIIGQDPYHNPQQAHGLSFSVRENLPLPPSLRNIYKELQNDLKIPPAKHGNLSSWGKQGVLLLNATLTVRQGEAKSHFNKGWEKFTDALVTELTKKEDPIIFVLWGRSAIDKCQKITNYAQNQHHKILTAAHPSPFSAHKGFFDCRHFSKINALLKSFGKKPIDWTII